MHTFTTVEQKRRNTIRLLARQTELLPLHRESRRVLSQLRADRADSDERLGELARLDPALAARFLLVANHAFNLRPDEPLTLSWVITQAGAEAICQASTRTDMSAHQPVDAASQQDIWLHCVQVAIAAKYFAQQAGGLAYLAEEAYLHGLLHDLGRIVMLAVAQAKTPEIDQENWVTGAELVAVEEEICGYDHATLGWLACRAWNFPESLAAVNKLHHRPQAAREAELPERTDKVLHLVALADELSLLMMQSPAFLAAPTADRLATLSDTRVASAAAELGMPLHDVEAFVAPLDHVSKMRLAHMPSFATTAYAGFAPLCGR